VVPERPKPQSGIQVAGLPTNSAGISGLMFVGYLENRDEPSLFTYTQIFAEYSDPPRNLLSNFDHEIAEIRRENPIKPNINVGAVQYGDITTATEESETSVFYWKNRFGPVKVESSAEWKIMGNRSFYPMSVSIQRGIPKLINYDKLSKTRIILDSVFRIDLRDFISNFDSAVVTIKTGDDDSEIAKKRTSANDPVVFFSKTDLSFLETHVLASLSLQAFNYSWQLTDGKTMVYEMAAQMDKDVSVRK
jgi:hypothetical protein